MILLSVCGTVLCAWYISPETIDDCRVCILNETVALVIY